ncbi:MAG TPA: DUF2971 domain-containing protein [Pseudomonadales bacterium]|nr:DUF2971 domain-containing protein [Pseudomonadales bacterium]
MKLYKYRTLSNLEYMVDILFNERLHCAPYNELNDPFEGLFLSVMHIGSPINSSPLNFDLLGGSQKITAPQSISELPISGGTRVCSLSGSNSDVRLWSHYAGGHSGIAIEVDIESDTECLYAVEYVDQLKQFSYGLLTSPESCEILKIKTKHWSYEKEYRLITDKPFFSVSGKITGMYVGLRTSDHMRKMLRKIVGNAFPIYSTKLNEQSIEIELNKQVN